MTHSIPRLGAGLAFIPLLSLAMLGEARADTPFVTSSEAGAEVTVSGKSGYGTTLAMVPYVSTRVGRSDVFLDVEMPFATSTASPKEAANYLGTSGAETGVGNPGLSAHVILPVNRRLFFTVGGGVHLPVAQTNSMGATWATLMATEGSAETDFQRWDVQYVPFTLSLGAAYRATRSIELRVLIQPIFLPTYDPSFNTPFGSGFVYSEQNQLEVEVRTRTPLRFGGDLNDSFWVDPSARAAASQLSVEPYAEFMEGAFFARAGALVAIGGTSGEGIYGGTGPALGLAAHLRIGGQID